MPFPALSKNKGYNGEKKTFQNLWATEGYLYKQKKRSSKEDLFTLTLTGYPPPNYWIIYIIIQKKILSRANLL